MSGMAEKKVRQIKGSPYWHVRYTDVTGKERQVSTHETSKRKAEAELRRIEGQIERGGQVLPSSRSVRLEQLLENVITDYRISGKSSLRDLEARVDLHIVPFFNRIRAVAVTTPLIREYIALRQTQGAKNGTINRELTAIKRAFKLGTEEGILMQMPYVPMLKESAPRSGFFTDEEIAAVCRHLPAHLRPAVRFGYLTGWRKGEIAALEWRNVTTDEVRLDPGTTKSGAGRVFPITDALRAVLDSVKPTKKDALKTPLVFWYEKDGEIWPIGDFRKSWSTACKKAGVPGRLFHDLRRSAYRTLVRQGITERVAMDMVGWSNRGTADRYNIVAEGDLSAARKILDHATSKAST